MQGNPEEIKQKNLLVSRMAETLIGSEIIRLAGEINEKIKNGEKIYNLTIGDFDPKIFPIPAELEEEIIKAYKEKQTNYPPANGIAELRKAVSDFINEYEHLYYSSDDILIAAGARPLIYAVYQTIVEPGEKVIFPVPSWNNNHYTHLSHAQKIEIAACAENNFMPSADDIKPFVKDASLISLCSPLNPTGTVFSEQDLAEICETILKEAKVAIVPFYAFGDSDNSPWYRLSVGTCRLNEVDGIINSLETALKKLRN